MFMSLNLLSIKSLLLFPIKIIGFCKTDNSRNGLSTPEITFNVILGENLKAIHILLIIISASI